MVLILSALLLAGFLAYIFWKGPRKILSPIPPQPDFQVIYQTPLPTREQVPGTPTVTPKAKTVLPTATVRPTLNLSPTVKVSTASPTKKAN